MCGITGKFRLRGASVTPQEIERMNAALSARGPDDSGVYISSDARVGLGQQRLAIIDLSARGHQPMAFADRYHIVFNGEIYNFASQRKLLEAEGYTFSSQTDTEVIAALYDKYQEKCLEHMRGMFAFAVYDTQDQILFCARDRVGKKPFKYYWDGNVFIFASELKALLKEPEIKRQVDYSALSAYLTLQYVPAPHTGFLAIQKLEAGHFLKIDLRSGQLIKERYWQLQYNHSLALSEAAWQQKILTAFDEAVRLRLVADVPIGAFLSGGIDSSAVVAFMARQMNTPPATFSVGFKDKKISELPYARLLAKQYNTQHTELFLEKTHVEILPEVVRVMEEPFADHGALPSYLISQQIRQHVTVALSGDGGDENFAGYSRYGIHKLALLADRLGISHLPWPALANVLERIYPSLSTHRLGRFLKTLPQAREQRYLSYICYFTAADKHWLLTPAAQRLMGEDGAAAFITKLFKQASRSAPLHQALSVDFNSYLADDLLPKTDLTSMAHGLEVRSPFLDHVFLELTAQIPPELTLKGFTGTKYILKKSLEGVVPAAILHRPKQGFGVPLQAWFREDIGRYAACLLLSKQALERNIWRRQAVEQMLSRHRRQKADHGRQLWALLCLELWFRQYID